MTGFELRNPPVIETSLGVQFSDLESWTPIHHGLFFNRIRDRFPGYDCREIMDAIVETFPISRKIRKLQFSPGVPDLRAEYATRDESTLISIQKNRFSFHWKDSPDGSYPRYHANRVICRKEYEDFQDYCLDAELGEIKPLICEAMYLNRIYPREGESLNELCEDIFSLSLGDHEAATVNRTYVLDDNRGRLYSEINTVLLDEPFLLLKLTSRVRHEGGEAMSTLDIAHDWLISKFCDLTSARARKERWEQA